MTNLPPKERSYVLVIEDDGATAKLMKTLIEEDLAVRVKVVRDGLAALDAVATLMPLAVIVDLMVPELDGEEFMAEVRRQYGVDVPMVVVSALAPGRVQAAADQAQAWAVPKPFDIDELVAAVAEAVAPWFVAGRDQEGGSEYDGRPFRFIEHMQRYKRF